MSRPAFARIDLGAIEHNLRVVRERAPGARVMAVVKADGYGHGLERVAVALGGADAFGVASLEDAERLRAAGHRHRIVLLSGFSTPDELPRLQALGLDSVIHHASQLQMLEQRSASLGGPPLRVWLKVDSGMHRLGFPAAQAAAAYHHLRSLAAVDPDITWMTHFACSDAFDSERTMRQVRCFDDAVGGLPGGRSMANSAAVLGWPQTRADWIRPGGALYGLSVVPERDGDSFGLRPAMTLGSRVIAVNEVPAGEAIGYGDDWVAGRALRVGVVALGYGDGYPRAARPGTPMLVEGRRAPLIGRVSMDLMTLDLSSIPEAGVGSEVIAWGEGLSAETVARHAGTIAYELACSVTRRVSFEVAGTERAVSSGT